MSNGFKFKILILTLTLVVTIGAIKIMVSLSPTIKIVNTTFVKTSLQAKPTNWKQKILVTAQLMY